MINLGGLGIFIFLRDNNKMKQILYFYSKIVNVI